MRECAPSLHEAFLSRKCLVMAALGIASGLPFWIVTKTATALLADLHIDRKTIGVLGAVPTIYAFKFVWSFLVDARGVPLLRGQRRRWLLATQVPMAILIAALALVAPMSAESSLAMFAWCLVIITALSATQDIVVNGWTVDAFPRAELGVGSSMYVLGYRAAYVVAGTLALSIAATAGWQAAFVTLAVIMLGGAMVALCTREPHRDTAHAATPTPILEPLRDLVSRLGAATTVALVLLFVLIFRLPDQLAAPMQEPLLLTTLGYDVNQFGIAKNGFGVLAMIVGALAGGAMVARWGMMRGLAIAGILQALSNLGFVWIAQAVAPLEGVKQAWLAQPIIELLVVSAIESACGGVVGTVFVAWLMSLCTPRYGASQYALLTAGFALAAGLASWASGHLADRMDWPAYFLFTTVAAVPGMALLPFAVRAARRAVL